MIDLVLDMGRYSPNFMANYLVACRLHNPEGEVMVYGEHRVTWDELVSRVFCLARALLELGIRHGDKVALMLHNSPAFIEANLAIQAAGAIPVPVNYRFTSHELARQLSHADATILIYEPFWQHVVAEAAADLPDLRIYICTGDTETDLEPLSCQALIDAQEGSDPERSTDGEDVAVMIYTGGTTGFPKGVMLTYGAHLQMFAGLMASMVSQGARIDLTEEQIDRVADVFPLPGFKQLLPLARTPLARKIAAHPAAERMLRAGAQHLLSRPELARVGYSYSIGYMTPSMPFFHVASYQSLMLMGMVGNIRLILPAGPSFDPPRVLELIHREKPFFLANVPTGWERLLSCSSFDAYDVSSIRVGATGGAACPIELKRRIMERFEGIILVDMLGQTEMSPITSFKIDADQTSLRERSVGHAFVETRVVDEHGNNQPPGELGEVWYRSQTLMKGYYKDEAATRSATADGWFRSGDLGYLDEHGELCLVDRASECINTGGEKVFPGEVERILTQHPRVQMACVIGVPDEEWGSTVRAVVQPVSGQTIATDDLVDHCRQHLAGFKVPRSVIVVEQLPVSPVGKVQRGRVRQEHGQS